MGKFFGRDSVYGIRDAGCRILDTGYGMVDTGCGILDTGYGMQDTGYKIGGFLRM